LAAAYRTISQGIRQLEREDKYSPPSSAKAKNVWNCTSTALYASMVWVYIALAQLGIECNVFPKKALE